MNPFLLNSLRRADPRPRRGADRNGSRSRRASPNPPRPLLPDLLPDYLRACTFARLEPGRHPEAYRVCQEYALKGSYQGCWRLLLAGCPGAGKSSLAAAILHQTLALTQDPHAACFWPQARGLRLLRQSLAQPPAQRYGIADLLDYRLVIVDHLQRPASAWETHQLDLLLETLWAEDRPAVFTTDLAPTALSEAFAPVQLWPFLYLCHVLEFTKWFSE